MRGSERLAYVWTQRGAPAGRPCTPTTNPLFPNQCRCSHTRAAPSDPLTMRSGPRIQAIRLAGKPSPPDISAAAKEIPAFKPHFQLPSAPTHRRCKDHACQGLPCVRAHGATAAAIGRLAGCPWGLPCVSCLAAQGACIMVWHCLACKQWMVNGGALGCARPEAARLTSKPCHTRLLG